MFSSCRFDAFNIPRQAVAGYQSDLEITQLPVAMPRFSSNRSGTPSSSAEYRSLQTRSLPSRSLSSCTSQAPAYLLQAPWRTNRTSQEQNPSNCSPSMIYLLYHLIAQKPACVFENHNNSTALNPHSLKRFKCSSIVIGK